MKRGHLEDSVGEVLVKWNLRMEDVWNWLVTVIRCVF
jgi:hypothetical protein